MPPAPRPWLGRALIGMALAVGIALPYLGLPAPNLLYLPYAGVFGLLLAGLLLAPSPWWAPRWLGHVGKVSYSAYFIHFLVIRELGLATMNWMARRSQPEPAYVWIFVGYTLLAVALTVALSTLTYRWIERPGIAAGRRALALVSGRAGRDAG
jgi:peptidoglycan/LPS O-acetylase OafA/YrhL